MASNAGRDEEREALVWSASASSGTGPVADLPPPTGPVVDLPPPTRGPTATAGATLRAMCSGRVWQKLTLGAAALTTVALFLVLLWLPVNTAFHPELANKLLYGFAGINCVTWVVYARFSGQLLVEVLNLFGFSMELVYTTQVASALLWPALSGAVFYAVLVCGCLYLRWFDPTFSFGGFCVLEFLGIGTTVLATGAPLLHRVFTGPPKVCTPAVPATAFFCGLLWAISSYLAGNQMMLLANLAAACFGGVLALLNLV